MNPCAAAEQGTLVALVTAAILAVLLALAVAWGLQFRAVAARLIRAEMVRREQRPAARQRRAVGFDARSKS